MFEKTCCDKNMAEPFTCGQLRLDIQRLTTQLADRDAEIARIQTISDNYFALATDRVLEITTLRTKLAECEKDVERLKLGKSTWNIQIFDGEENCVYPMKPTRREAVVAACLELLEKEANSGST